MSCQVVMIYLSWLVMKHFLLEREACPWGTAESPSKRKLHLVGLVLDGSQLLVLWLFWHYKQLIGKLSRKNSLGEASWFPETRSWPSHTITPKKPWTEGLSSWAGCEQLREAKLSSPPCDFHGMDIPWHGRDGLVQKGSLPKEHLFNRRAESCTAKVTSSLNTSKQNLIFTTFLWSVFSRRRPGTEKVSELSHSSRLQSFYFLFFPFLCNKEIGHVSKKPVNGG